MFGSTLESIQGLGVDEPEYEAKKILSGQWQQQRAYMDQLENMAQLQNNDVQGFEKFADLVRITVVKLQAEGHNEELGEVTYSLLVKKLLEAQVQGYSCWLWEQGKEESALSLKDRLKEEVLI